MLKKQFLLILTLALVAIFSTACGSETAAPDAEPIAEAKTIEREDGSIFVGEVSEAGDLVYGTLTLDGVVYVGEFEENEPGGQGEMTWADGTIYSGSFAMGALNGPGTKTYPDGTVEEGDWNDGDLGTMSPDGTWSPIE